MPLINNSIESVYNGVSQQAAEHRQPTQVAEMINAYPTIDSGLLKRNPTTRLDTSLPITYSGNMWTYEYDRGLSGQSEEKYAVKIVDGIMEIVNVVSGKVYKEGNGLLFEGNAKSYLHPFVNNNGYSAVTVKDTTFILNKNEHPEIDELIVNTDYSTQQVTANISTINLKTPDRVWANVNKCGHIPQYELAPTKYYENHCGNSMGSTTTVSVDGTIINYVVPYARNLAEGGKIDTWDEYKANVYDKIKTSLSSSLYSVTMDGLDIAIKKLDGTALAVSFAIAFEPLDGSSTDAMDSIESDYYTGITASTEATDYTPVPTDYEKTGYAWISGANPTSAYTYSVTAIDMLDNTVVATTSTDTTSTGAASTLAGDIDANVNFTAVVKGSMIQITAVNANMKSIVVSDSYGNKASFGWTKEVAYHTDLPADLGFDGIVKVTGNIDNGFDEYWLKSVNGVWKETLDPAVNTTINADTMPHVLVSNTDDTFTLKPYDQWAKRLVGDNESNKYPSFITDADETPKIKDIFFFKNRLGFITDRSVVMSEVGEYGNFWRTTVATLLDSDPIDTVVDTTKAIQLEYATYMEDSVMLFSDKAQFKLAGGKILSPASVQITQTSAYEINKNIRPLYMNDKIFFCVTRGTHTAVMQYQIKSTNAASEAVDVTAHVQSYIPSSVDKMSGDAANNMLFLTVKNSDTMYVYKYYDHGANRVQSAWFKWVFNGTIHNAFSLGRNLNIMINRYDKSNISDWVLGTGIWGSEKTWDSNAVWISAPENLVTTNQLETMPIAPLDYQATTFYDDLYSDNQTPIQTDVNFGEWIPSFKNMKNIRGNVKFKTVQISSEENSDFSLVITDNNRGDTRTVEAKYTVDRKPMVYGDVKNMEIGVQNYSSSGFRINTIDYEGNYNSRSSKQ